MMYRDILRTQILNKKIVFNEMTQSLFGLLALFLLVQLGGCSASKPAPISDRSSTQNVPKDIPSRPISMNSGTGAAKVNPVPAPRPIVQKNNPKETVKPEAKSDSSKTTNAIDSGFKLLKPSEAPLVTNFNEVSNKGIEFSGKLGDPILAAADGRVIYSGSNLRTYGNLIILNHNNSFVTVYANNKTLLVKEGDTVKRGQKIAEMGNSESDKVKLHFELRKNSKPIDPSSYFVEN